MCVLEREKTVFFLTTLSHSDLWEAERGEKAGADFCVVARLNLSLKNCWNISILGTHSGCFMSWLFWNIIQDSHVHKESSPDQHWQVACPFPPGAEFTGQKSLCSLFFYWRARVCPQLGRAMDLHVLKVQHESQKSTFKNYNCESAGPLNICFCFLIVYKLFYSVWERALEKKKKRGLELLRIILSRRLFQLQNHFPQYLENQFWWHFFLLKKVRGLSALIVSEAYFNFCCRSTSKNPKWTF